MREDAATKARRLLGEGRVALLWIDDRSVDAVVRGDAGEFYRVSHRPGSWVCSCPHTALSTSCSHVQAVQLVTPFGRRGDGWRPVAEIIDRWQDAPVDRWERAGEALPNGIEKRRVGALMSGQRRPVSSHDTPKRPVSAARTEFPPHIHFFARGPLGRLRRAIGESGPNGASRAWSRD
jgi:hypothetical protein